MFKRLALRIPIRMNSTSSTTPATFSILNTKITKSPVSGPVENKILVKLLSLSPTRVSIFNDSHKHSHHKSMEDAENTAESHFRLEIISEEFEGKAQPARHRMIYSLLKEEIEVDKVHALQLKTKTPVEVGEIPEKHEPIGCGHDHSQDNGHTHSHSNGGSCSGHSHSHSGNCCGGHSHSH